jgi:hypothetical protein
LSNASGPTPQRSQHSVITPMPPGSQAEDFINDASTTTSGKKTSESNRSSDKFNTQSSNGITGSGQKDHSDASKAHEDAHIPDTQGLSPTLAHFSAFMDRVLTDSTPEAVRSSQSSVPSQPHSQPPVPPFPATSRTSAPAPHAPNTSISSLLNSPTTEEPTHADFIVDDRFIGSLHDQFTRRTSGCSIEQLEQINSALMDSIWKQRGVWNRTVVGIEVSEVFNAIIKDVEEMQEVLPASLATQ